MAKPGSSVADDRILVERVLSGDESAFDEIYDHAHQQVYRVALAITGDVESARDVVQETFLVVYRKLHTWRGASAVRTWITRIAVRAACDALKRSRRRSVALREDVAFHDPRPTLERSLLAEDIGRLAHRVPGRPGIVLRLRLLAGLSNRDIARQLDTSEANVRMHLTTAIRKLRALL